MRLLIVVAGLLTIAYLTPCYAITDTERAGLHRLQLELTTIESIIDQAAHNASTHARFQVDYDQLRQDVKAIQQGIEDALKNRRREPRSLPPIEGDYH
ncbi:MAG: hypothetical protein CL866_09030 [Cycloclasticus sp.]|nr:hypothetical protein [Cycloclasticus sp.]MBG96986.1 hypothetical protein [Cycloclasticus sp.]|tara:strand:- start:488 stop:781 length:294 start_codon:yes stop_codon:yes gene_type:complete